MLANAGEVYEPVYRAQQVILRDVILNRKLVEQRDLRLLPWSHHRDQSPIPMWKLNQLLGHKTTGVFQRNRPQVTFARTQPAVRFRTAANSSS
jgi:hypothetical protein